MRTSSYREALLNRLTDPEEAKAYLDAARDDSEAALKKALGNVTEAADLKRVVNGEALGAN